MRKKSYDSEFSDSLELDEELPVVKLEEPSSDSLDSIGSYLKQIGEWKLLSREEVVELYKKIEAGREATTLLNSGEDSLELKQKVKEGLDAKTLVIESNLRLVVSVAKRYQNRGLDMFDLIQEGNIGLMRAVEKFDYKRGFMLSTYSMWWIRQSLARACIERGHSIKLPTHIGDDGSKLSKARGLLSAELGREPTIEELANKLGETPAYITNLQRWLRPTISLDWDLLEGDSDSDGFTMIKTLESDEEDVVETASRNTMTSKIRAILDELPPRERVVIEMCYGLKDGKNHNLGEIGKFLGVTRERTRQLKMSAIGKLKTLAIEQGLTLDF